VTSSLPRAIAHLNTENFEMSALVATWAPVPAQLRANEFAGKIRDILTNECDGAMPRITPVGFSR